jgi:hypothetical protein
MNRPMPTMRGHELRLRQLALDPQPDRLGRDSGKTKYQRKSWTSGGTLRKTWM